MIFNEEIPEYPVTNWEGACVRVVVELPPDRGRQSISKTSQMFIDMRDLEVLRALKEPEGLEHYPPDEKMYHLIQWRNEYEQAVRLCERLANQIAQHLARSIKESI